MLIVDENIDSFIYSRHQHAKIIKDYINDKLSVPPLPQAKSWLCSWVLLSHIIIINKKE